MIPIYQSIRNNYKNRSPDLASWQNQKRLESSFEAGDIDRVLYVKGLQYDAKIYEKEKSLCS